MTARISRNFEFQAGVHFNDDFYMNLYDIEVTFNVESDSIRQQNVALDRIKYFLGECIEFSIMCSDSDTEAIEKYIKANLKVCTLPEEPYDQIIGIMLLVKFNAITEGRLVATDIKIASRISDGVSCLFGLEENIGPFKMKGWWNDSSTKINDYKYVKDKKSKVVQLSKPIPDWQDVFLGWTEKNTLEYNGEMSEVVFASFDTKNTK